MHEDLYIALCIISGTAFSATKFLRLIADERPGCVAVRCYHHLRAKTEKGEVCPEIRKSYKVHTRGLWENNRKIIYHQNKRVDECIKTHGQVPELYSGTYITLLRTTPLWCRGGTPRAV